MIIHYHLHYHHHHRSSSCSCQSDAGVRPAVAAHLCQQCVTPINAPCFFFVLEFNEKQKTTIATLDTPSQARQSTVEYRTDYVFDVPLSSQTVSIKMLYLMFVNNFSFGTVVEHFDATVVVVANISSTSVFDLFVGFVVQT